MGRGLVVLMGLVLAVSPAYAQAKTKASAVHEAAAALDVCETFAKGDAAALDNATAAGWDAYDQEGESPFVHSYGGSREIPGMGWADMFVLFEDYPDRTLGYCRLDVASPTGKGDAVIKSIAGLDRYEGEVKEEDGGTYASLVGTDGRSVLLTHWNESAFVIQLTIITPKDTAGAE